MKTIIKSTSIFSCEDVSKSIEKYISSKTIIVCIGTDKCIGDSLGPLVGTLLQENNFPLQVYGTLKYPIHALNINKKLLDINSNHPDSTIIGIDACLGSDDSIGEIHVRDYPIFPGKGVGKSLPSVGTASIIGIIDSSDSLELFTTRNIRLNLVFEMAKIISNGIYTAYSNYKKNNNPIN